MSLLNQEIPKMPDFSKPVFKLFTTAAEDIKAGKCPMCARELASTPFRDLLSEREFSISGMCQVCQDSIFGSGDCSGEPDCDTCASNDNGTLCKDCEFASNYVSNEPV